MAQKTKEIIFYKKEAKRSKAERVCRDVVCYGVTIFAAVMGFLLVNANVNLANAESDYASNQIHIVQA